MNNKRWRVEYFYADSDKQLNATEIQVTKPMNEIDFRKLLKVEIAKRKPTIFKVTTRGFIL